MKASDEIPVEEQDEYVLLHDTGRTNYKTTKGWEPGTTLRRVSKWLSGNGCGVRQAYFVPIGSSNYPRIAWEDHVKPTLGQIELEI